MDELLVVVRGEEEAAGIAVVEVVEQLVAELDRPLQVLRRKSAWSTSRSAASRKAWSSR
jgi:hypothetical protein